MGLAAIGAGAALAMGGATAIGAVGGAIAAGTIGALSVGTVLTAVATVGAVVGAVGKIAGVEELQTAGMVLGGIGGIGSLANAVGAFGEGASIGSIFGSGGADVTAGDFSGISGVSDSADDILGASAFGGSSGGAGSGLINSGTNSLDSVTGAIGSQGNSWDIITAANKLAGVNVSDEAQLAGGTSGDAPQQKLTNTTPKTSTLAKQNKVDDIVEGPTSDDNAKVVPEAGSKVTGTVSVAGGAAGGAAKTDDKPGFWSTNTGTLTALGMIQSAGSFLSGAFDEVKPAQANAYNAQAAANNAQAALTNKELSNMNSNIPTARRVAVTGSLLNPGRVA